MFLEKFLKSSLDLKYSVGCPAELYTFPPLPASADENSPTSIYHPKGAVN